MGAGAGKKKAEGEDAEGDEFADMEDQGPETMAEEGNDTDIESEENERYNRRPKPPEGPVERATQGGFLSRQPCRSAIISPTAHVMAHNAHEKPDHHLTLEWIYGYRAHDSRHNIFYNIDGQIVYPAAGTGVVYDPQENVQRFFIEHTDDIVSLAMHPEQELIASGQVGKDPAIVIWSTNTRQPLATIQGFHQRAVVSLSFDATGKYLATLGLDDEHSVAVYEWETRRMVANSKGDEYRIFNCEYNPYDGRLVTGGVKHIKFWVMEGAYLVGKNGVYGNMGSVSTILAIAFHTDGSTLTGTQGGAIYQWADGGEECIQKYDCVHQGPVHDIHVTEDYIITGGKDGKVNFFSVYMEKMFTIDVALVAQSMMDLQGRPLVCYTGKSPCVKAVYMQGTNLIVGLKNSEIVEFDMSTADSWMTNHKFITQGHAAMYDSVRRVVNSELWGLATHPFKLQYMTVSDDQTLRLWDIESRQMMAAHNLSAQARSVAYSMDGKHAAVGFITGGFVIIDLVSGAELESRNHRREEISELKYSPDGRWLAVGSHDNFIDLYDCLRNYKRIGVCKGHSSYITHVDWSEDSKFLQSNSGDYELLYWEIPSCDQIKFPSALKDCDWYSWTATLGWPVQGIWPKHADGTDVNACDRTKDKQAIATADDFGGIKMFHYPCDVGRSDYNLYLGHGTHVTGCRFTYNDDYLISIGGGDRCIFQWRHYQSDEYDEEISSDVEEEVYLAIEDYQAAAKTAQATNVVLTGYLGGIPQYIPEETAMVRPSRDIPQGTGLDPGSRLAFMPCASAIFGPDGYLREPDAMAPSTEAIELEFAHGFRAHDARDCLFYTNRGEVVYHTATLGIVYNKESNKQRFLYHDPNGEHYTGHSDSVVCIARHPTGSIFATGEVGRNPKLIVWSSSDPRRPLAILQGFLKQGIASCTFSRDGTMVAAVGLDNDHSLAIYRWNTGTLLTSAKGSQEMILQIKWSPFQDYILTLGVKHCRFWSTEPFKYRKALFSRRGKLQTMLCATFPGPDTSIVGTQDGSIYLFKGFQLATNVKQCHHVTQALCSTRDVVVSGGKEGRIKFWAVDLSQCLKELEITHPMATASCIKSLFLLGTMLLIGTRTSEVYEMDTTSYSYTLLLQGHGYGVVWGIAPHPFEHQYVTVGDDGTVRLWDVASRRMVMVRNLGAQGRSADFHPDGSQIAVGLASGGVVILSSDSLDTMHTKKDREEPIHVVKFSPNGQYLVAGAYDNYIDVYDLSKMYGRVGVAKGHSSYIRHMDWSHDSTSLQSNSGDLQLLYWEMPSGKQIKFPADLKNIDWSCWTCTAGWPVQGIWSRVSNGKDVASCDRSHTRTCVISGDDYGMVNLYQYPAHRGTARRMFAGHAGKVTQVRFLFDDSYIVSVGSDMTVLQWRVVI